MTISKTNITLHLLLLLFLILEMKAETISFQGSLPNSQMVFSRAPHVFSLWIKNDPIEFKPLYGNLTLYDLAFNFPYNDLRNSQIKNGSTNTLDQQNNRIMNETQRQEFNKEMDIFKNELSSLSFLTRNTNILSSSNSNSNKANPVTTNISDGKEVESMYSKLTTNVKQNLRDKLNSPF